MDRLAIVSGVNVFAARQEQAVQTIVQGLEQDQVGQMRNQHGNPTGPDHGLNVGLI
jgi:hypothetical protein